MQDRHLVHDCGGHRRWVDAGEELGPLGHQSRPRRPHWEDRMRVIAKHVALRLARILHGIHTDTR